METTPFRSRRRDRLIGRAAATTHPPPDPAPADQVVADAEDIVVDAWVQALIGHRDQRQADAQAADARCDTARRTLAVALVERRPGPIAAAHAGLEQALSAARAADGLRVHAQQGLVLELDRLTWRSVERTVEACIARGDPGTPHSPVGRPADPAGPASALARWFRRLMPWVLYVVASFTAGAHPS